MTTYQVDFAAGDPWPALSNGDIVEYVAGNWSHTGATQVVSSIDNLTVRPATPGSKLIVDSYKTVGTGWTQIDPADGTTASFTSGLWKTANPAGGDDRDYIVWPGSRTTVYDGLVDADALTSAGFLANWRRGMGKYRRTGYVNDDRVTIVPADAPTEEGQWSVGDPGLFMYTGSTTLDPTAYFGAVYYRDDPVWRFNNCNNLNIDASDFEAIAGWAPILITTSGATGYQLKTATLDGFTASNCYKGVLATGAGAATEDEASTYLGLTVKNCNFTYIESNGINCKGHLLSSVLQDNYLHYTGIGDPIGAIYNKVWAKPGFELVVERNDISFHPYGNTWVDGFGIYSEFMSSDIIIRRNKIRWCKVGVHLGGSNGPELCAFNDIQYCGGMVRVIGASFDPGQQSHDAMIYNNTGRYLNPSDWQAFLFGETPAAFVVHQSVLAGAQVDIKNNIAVANSGETGNYGIRVMDAGVTFSESNNALTGFTTPLWVDSTTPALDATSSTTTQSFVDDENITINSAPAKDGGVSIAGVTDSTDYYEIPVWPDTPDIGARTVYPIAASTRTGL